jgi:hypothetical protein
MIPPEHIEKEKEVRESAEVNVNKWKSVIILEQKGKGVHEESSELMNEDRPWIMVGPGGKQETFQRGINQEQQGQERGNSSKNLMGPLQVFPQDHFQGKSKPWQRSHHHNNQGMKSLNLRFDNNGKLISPLEAQP